MSSVTCSVCIEHLAPYPACSLKCGHVFHSKCLDKCMKRKRECPVCRKRVNETGIRKLYFSGVDGEIDNEMDDANVPESSKNNGEGMCNCEPPVESSSEDEDDSGEENDSDGSNSSDDDSVDDEDEDEVDSDDNVMELDIEDSDDEGMDGSDNEEENVAAIIESQTAEIEILRQQLDETKAELEASRARELELTAQHADNSNGTNNSRFSRRQLKQKLVKSEANVRKLKEEHGLALRNAAELQQKLEQANHDLAEKTQELNNIRQNAREAENIMQAQFKELFSKAFGPVTLKRPSNESSEASGNDKRQCSTSRT